MKLKSLEISGFKSFADKTKIEFKPGMTGIVGPNGSGKSNVIEAIRWVMGEQSAKGLRGDKMQDVIFGGTSKRSPLNRAEVTITFDNSDHYLKTDFTEVRISRRLYRSGESNYLINGQDVRLRDIVELFMDTGLGRESFSIISQGRVEAIFNSKAEDRRTIIEEVAGVYKYKQNKERAQKELKQTQENLDRVQDILQEVEGRVEPLAKQAAVAQDYLAQKQQYDALEKSRLVIEIDEYLTVKMADEQKITTLAAVTKQQQVSIEEQADTLKTLKKTQARLNERRDELQAQLVTLAQTTERLHGLQNITVEREQNRTATVAELTASLDQTKAQLAEVNDKLIAQQTTFARQQAEIEKVTLELTNLSQQTSASRIEELQAQLTDLENSHLANVKKHAMLQSGLQTITQTITNADVNGDDLTMQIRMANEKLAMAQTQHDDLANQHAKAIAQQAKTEAEFKAISQEYQNRQREHQVSQQAWFDGLKLVKQAQARLESLHALESEYSGYYQGVRNLMREREQFSGIAGVVADLLQVPLELSKAIEITLGGALQQVVVDNENTAKKCVKWLTHQRLGRVTFLPLSVIKARKLPLPQGVSIKNIPGFVGIASELVNSSTEYQQIVSYLLGATVIAADLDSATTIAKVGQHRFKVVTLDGQVINPGGSITGGAQKNDTNGVLQQKVEMEQLSKAVATMNTELATNEAKVKKLVQVVSELTEAGTTKRSEVANCNETVQILATKLKLAAENVSHLKQQADSLKRQQSTFTNSLDEMQQQKQASQQAIVALEKQITAEQTTISKIKTEIELLTNNQSALGEQIQVKREWLAEKNAVLRALEDTVSTLIKQQTELKATRDQLLHRVELFTADEAELLQAGNRAKAELATAEATYTAATAELATLKDELSQINGQVKLVEDQLTKLQANQKLSLQELSVLNANQARNETLLEQAQTQLTADYGLTLAAAQQELVDLPIADIKTQLKLIKRGIDELGDVNLGAITEYQEVLERFQFLDGQQSDLISARDNLFATMNEMDAEVGNRFKTTFDAVATQFSRIFGQMFGGGKAELRLTDSDNILTTGIDIMAQPPGKKFQQMSLLSGGEKALTAITLLFAILAVRPVPFAILDETEAALDDANVTRFAQYLKTFQNDTQFIVITHRKGTMVNADVLYGITMQESGISKLVAVNLADLK